MTRPWIRILAGAVAGGLATGIVWLVACLAAVRRAPVGVGAYSWWHAEAPSVEGELLLGRWVEEDPVVNPVLLHLYPDGTYRSELPMCLGPGPRTIGPWTFAAGELRLSWSTVFSLSVSSGEDFLVVEACPETSHFFPGTRFGRPAD